MEITSIKYINMEKDHEKRFLLEKVLSRYTYSIQRISGVAYSQNPDSYKNYTLNGLASYVASDSLKRQNGVIGCWIAHVQALESTVETEGYTVVVEDDFVCKDSFFEKALAMLNNSSIDLDVAIFDPKGEGPLSCHLIQNGIYNSQGDSFPLYAGSHCVFYKNSRIQALLKIINSSEIRDYDGYLLCNQNIKTYLFYTGLSRTIYFYSDIEDFQIENSLWRGVQDWINYTQN